MLVIARSATNPIAVLNFSSLEDCDAIADHISQIRTPNESNIGLPGAWKTNFKYGGKFRQEPRIAMLCIPSTEDLPAVVKGLEEKEFYRDLYGDKKD